MWFIADVFERYTTSVACAFVRLAVQEAEANRRALEKMRARRLKSLGLAPAVLTPERDIVKPAALVHPVDGTALSAEKPVPVVTIVEADAAEAVNEAETAADVIAAVIRPELDPNRTFPMGVRGDVVIGWVDALFDAARSDVAELVEKLRKDKKVRVAELRLIAAEVMGEEPQTRKKADHLSAIRQCLAPEFARTAASDEVSAHA